MIEKKEFMVAWFDQNASAASMKRVNSEESARNLAVHTLSSGGRVVAFRREIPGGSKPVSWDESERLLSWLERNMFNVFDGRSSGYGIELKREKTVDASSALMLWGE